MCLVEHCLSCRSLWDSAWGAAGLSWLVRAPVTRCVAGQLPKIYDRAGGAVGRRGNWGGGRWSGQGHGVGKDTKWQLAGWGGRGRGRGWGSVDGLADGRVVENKT